MASRLSYHRVGETGGYRSDQIANGDAILLVPNQIGGSAALLNDDPIYLIPLQAMSAAQQLGSVKLTWQNRSSTSPGKGQNAAWRSADSWSAILPRCSNSAVWGWSGPSTRSLIARARSTRAGRPQAGLGPRADCRVHTPLGDHDTVEAVAPVD